jgi:hypothetical protein
MFTPVYRLEFNEEQQALHEECINKPTCVMAPNTFGWVTIFEKCGEIENRIVKVLQFAIDNARGKVTAKQIKKDADDLLQLYKDCLKVNAPLP